MRHHYVKFKTLEQNPKTMFVNTDKIKMLEVADDRNISTRIFFEGNDRMDYLHVKGTPIQVLELIRQAEEE